MRTLMGIAILCLTVSGLSAQQIPAGTLLPVMLNRTMESEKAKPGDEIEAKIMQDVPLPDNGKIKRNSKVTGHVVAATAPVGDKPAKITVQLDKVEAEKDMLTFSVGMRAYASMQIVAQARNPTNTNAGPGTSVWDLNVSQIGGQIAFNGAKIVKDPSGQVVGRVVQPGAIMGVPMANPERGCAGPGDNKAEQPFWIFSTNACGVYDQRDVTLTNGIGGATPGQITFQSPKNFDIRGGSGLLLQVN